MMSPMMPSGSVMKPGLVAPMIASRPAATRVIIVTVNSPGPTMAGCWR